MLKKNNICVQCKFLKLNESFEVVEKNTLPEPIEGQVRIKVQACGICHGDSITKQGLCDELHTRLLFIRTVMQIFVGRFARMQP